MMEERLRRIFRQSFGVERLEDGLSIDTVEGWDSMAHVGLMMALEKEFGVSVSPLQAVDLTDLAAIRKFLSERGAK